jgi:plastocyanin domain-containing protein
MLAAILIFFFGRRSARAALAGARPGGAVTIRVEGGYDPDTIIAPRGRPLRLLFDRREDSPCSDEVVFPDFGIRRQLPAHAVSEVVITPDRAGEFPFSCGMNMLHGKIVVVDEANGRESNGRVAR